MYINADEYQIKLFAVKQKPCEDVIDAEQYRQSVHNAIIDAETEMRV